ncbi:GyrI-like domain-containing protein [Ornithinimicrobium faecis]|uniref:GyrI-like domain-containing protein n=1 Tax=Ornithinimicrobium faecis TaxID=2934158 RepID=A0ABY4YPU3_9MICO|nr:GyrI-like domain-containing protein [Ornithinimicrobium sp. HY1793]USQ78162.1 GyrI-like domain-containing protein [Ornithinimicrobium sp. HY1793]
MSEKVDLKKSLDGYQARTGQFRLLDVPELIYLMVDGQGDPNSAPAFAQALQALYPVAYTLKFASRRELGRDFVVPPLEGLWWAKDMDAFTAARDKSRWDWTVMLLVPDWIDSQLVESAIETVRAKKSRPPRIDDLRVESLAEGRCVQTLHVGAFDDEAAVLAQLHHEFIPGQGLALTGTHHEIYLSDVRRVAPDRQRTILRQPVRPA